MGGIVIESKEGGLEWKDLKRGWRTSNISDTHPTRNAIRYTLENPQIPTPRTHTNIRKCGHEIIHKHSPADEFPRGGPMFVDDFDE